MNRLPDQARVLVELATETSKRLAGSLATYVSTGMDLARGDQGHSTARTRLIVGSLVIPIAITVVLGYSWRAWFRPSSSSQGTSSSISQQPSRALRTSHLRPVVFVGPPGMGKTVLAQTVAAALGPKAARHILLWTTRPRLLFEVNGVDAYFVSRRTFARLASQGFFGEISAVPSADSVAADCSTVFTGAESDANMSDVEYYGVASGDIYECLGKGVSPIFAAPFLPRCGLDDCLSVHVTCSSLSATLPSLLYHARVAALSTFSRAFDNPSLRLAADHAGLVSATAVSRFIRSTHEELVKAAARAEAPLGGTARGAAGAGGVLGEWVAAVIASYPPSHFHPSYSDVIYYAALAAAVTVFRNTLMDGFAEMLGAGGSGAGRTAGHVAASSAHAGDLAPAEATDLVITLTAVVPTAPVPGHAGAPSPWDLSKPSFSPNMDLGCGKSGSVSGSLTDVPMCPKSVAAAASEVCNFLALSMPWLPDLAAESAAESTAEASAGAFLSEDAERAATDAAAEARTMGVGDLCELTTSAVAQLVLAVATAGRRTSPEASPAASQSSAPSMSAVSVTPTAAASVSGDLYVDNSKSQSERQSQDQSPPPQFVTPMTSLAPTAASAFGTAPAAPAPATEPSKSSPTTHAPAIVPAPARGFARAPPAAAPSSERVAAVTVPSSKASVIPGQAGSASAGSDEARVAGRSGVAARAALFSSPPSASVAPVAPAKAVAGSRPAPSAVAARAQAFASALAAPSAPSASAPVAAEAAAAASAGAERRKSAFAASLESRLRAGPPQKAGGPVRHSLPAGMMLSPSNNSSSDAGDNEGASSARGLPVVPETGPSASPVSGTNTVPHDSTAEADEVPVSEGGMPSGGVRREGRIKIKRTNNKTKRYNFNADM